MRLAFTPATLLLAVATVAIASCDSGSNGSQPNQAPIAAYTMSPADGLVPLVVSFDASGSADADGRIDSFDWQFGDGAVGRGMVVQHSYDDPGDFAVRLTVTDDDGTSATAEKTVNVRPITAVAHFSVSVLPALSGSRFEPKDINDSGQVIGNSFFSDSGSLLATIHENGVTSELPRLDAGESYVRDINNAGQAVGTLSFPEGLGVAFLYEDGVTTDLRDVLGTMTGAEGINEAGLIVGTYERPDLALRSYIYNDGIVQDVGTLGGWMTVAVAINNADQVIGSGSTADGQFHAFVLSEGVLQDIGTLGGDNSYAHAVNDHGVIVGIATTIAGGANYRGFIYANGVMEEIGSEGDWHSDPADINNLGQIVGSIADHGFIWDETNGLRDLNDLVDPDLGFTIKVVTGINDRGQIVGYDYNDEGTAFLLTPER